MEAPDFWNDPERSQQLMKELKSKKDDVEVYRRLASQMEGKLSVYRSAGFFLECVPPGIEKAHSLAKLIATLGIAREEVIACGDGYNDKGMIEFAGLGVAMANASTEVQDAADYITYSNEEDGVAHVVEKFILA